MRKAVIEKYSKCLVEDDIRVDRQIHFPVECSITISLASVQKTRRFIRMGRKFSLGLETDILVRYSAVPSVEAESTTIDSRSLIPRARRDSRHSLRYHLLFHVEIMTVKPGEICPDTEITSKSLTPSQAAEK